MSQVFCSHLRSNKGAPSLTTCVVDCSRTVCSICHDNNVQVCFLTYLVACYCITYNALQPMPLRCNTPMHHNNPRTTARYENELSVFCFVYNILLTNIRARARVFYIKSVWQHQQKKGCINAKRICSHKDDNGKGR